MYIKSIYPKKQPGGIYQACVSSPSAETRKVPDSICHCAYLYSFRS